MPEFETLEELIAWIKENHEEVDGKIVVPAIREIQTNFEKATAAKTAAVDAKKKATKEKADLEAKYAEIESKIGEYESQIDSLQKSGTPDERYKALVDEKSAVDKQIKQLKEQIATFGEKEKQFAEAQSRIQEFELKEKTGRIWESIQKEAKALDIPSTVVDFDLKRFTSDFDVDEDGEIVLKSDPQKTIKTSLAEWQKERPHWQQSSQGAGAAPGKTQGSGGKSLSIGELFTTNITNATG